MKFSELKKMAMPLVDGMFKDLGFVKDKKIKVIYYYKKNDEYITYIAIGTAGSSYKDHFYVNIGLIAGHYKPLDILREIMGEDVTMNTKFSRDIGYLMPKNSFAEWDFCANCDMQEVLEDMRRAIVNYGIPYLEQSIEYEYYAERLWKHGILVHRYYIVPIVYYMLGKYEKSKECLDIGLDIFKNNIIHFESYPDYQEFCDKFNAYMKANKNK